METTMATKICTFNCRSVKSSVAEIRQLCENNDFVCLQEHWLLPFELGFLNSIDSKFLSHGVSAMDISTDVIKGRPFGGTAILFNRKFSNNVKFMTTNDSRVSAIEVFTSNGPLLLASVYLPVDYGDTESAENYTATCSVISALITEVEAAHVVICGDFNCQSGTRFHDILQHVVCDNSLVYADCSRLQNEFTFCSEANGHTSWIDHILCSYNTDKIVNRVNVLYNFVTSDHKPMVIDIDILIEVNDVSVSRSTTATYIDWDNVSDEVLLLYRDSLDIALSNVRIPVHLLHDSSTLDKYEHIDNYYNAVMDCILKVSSMTLPSKRGATTYTEYVVPGWNEYVAEKHKTAREAFTQWVRSGKPRSGPELIDMQQSRSKFKLAVRYCKKHEIEIRANILGTDLLNKDAKQFWKDVKRYANEKVTVHVDSVNGCTGDEQITDMWKDYFENLYNSVPYTEAKADYIKQIHNCNSTETDISINVRDLITALSKQKKNKSGGLDSIKMEAYLNGGLRLAVHVCLLFNMFIKHCYMPASFMKSVIVPLVKCKTKDLNDVNNYRAVVVSNAITKLFESVITDHIKTESIDDKYQFGFKAGHSTAMCTHVLKSTIDYYTMHGSHVFCCFVDISKAFDKVNYWKLFNKLIEDKVNVKIVQVLAFWYSQQQLCVRWHNSVSNSFLVTNGTKQGGILSPYLFSRYIRDVLKHIGSSNIGCIVGGIFTNILAFADDMVLITPSWYAMQKLINLLYVELNKLDMLCNVQKTQCMVFDPKCRSKIVSKVFPMFKIGDLNIKFVDSFKYLGHIIGSKLCDDEDINREIRNLFIRTNILKKRFARCSVDVKLQLFKSFCLCFYGVALWTHYTKSAIQKLSSCYNRCIKIFFNYSRMYSMTQCFVDLGLPTLNTMLHNSSMRFESSLAHSNNELIHHWVINYDITG